VFSFDHELAGKPLTTYRVIVELIAATTTGKGLKVQATSTRAATPEASRSTKSSPPCR